MANIIFPRPTVRIGTCLAVLTKRHGFNEKNSDELKPILEGRPWAKINGKWWKGARLSFHLNVKKIPRKTKSRIRGFVLHTCDNKWCLEPEHLYLGSQFQNVIDLYDRHPTIRIQRQTETKGRKRSLALRKKLSKIWKDRPKPWLRGKSLSPEHIEKIRQNKIGRKASKATRLKMSISHKRRHNG